MAKRASKGGKGKVGKQTSWMGRKVTGWLLSLRGLCGGQHPGSAVSGGQDLREQYRDQAHNGAGKSGKERGWAHPILKRGEETGGGV